MHQKTHSATLPLSNPKGLSLRARLQNPASRLLAREELRRRIMEIVVRLGEASDLAIWQASRPDYLPWNFLLTELRTLHANGRLRLEIVAAGHWIIHALSAAGPKTVHTPNRR